MKTKQLKLIEQLLEEVNWRFQDVFIDRTDNGESINVWRTIKNECEKLLKSDKDLTKKELKELIFETESKKNTPKNRGKLTVLLIIRGGLDAVETNFLQVVFCEKFGRFQRKQAEINES